MGFFQGRRSGSIAKERIQLLLSSERSGCTPQMMTMLQNDLIYAVGRYFTVREQSVEIRYMRETATFLAKIPLQKGIEGSSPKISYERQ